MAKKKASKSSKTGEAVVIAPRDRETLGRLVGLADRFVQQAESLRGDPHFDIPARSLSNVRFNQSRKIIEMGRRTNRRQLFNLSQARSFMQTVLAARGVKDLIEEGKTTSIRGLFYSLLGMVAGTKEKKFNDQGESDAVIEDLEVLADSLREELHLYATAKGTMVGEITLVDKGDEIDCSRMGSGGYGIPSIVEQDVIQFKKCEAEFILHVEKDTVWQRFNEDKFWRTHHCILTHGGGQPPRGVRRLLHRMHNELNLPVYCLLDNDPWGYYIYSVIKQGSINLAFESQRMAIPNARFMGLRSKDFERCDLSENVKIDLTETDRKRARQIAAYPWFAKKKAWQKEIQLMLDHGFKLEVEALISRDISYVTEEYTPARLKDQDFLD